MEEQESHGQHYTNVESVHTFYSSLHSIVQFQVLPQLNMTTKKSEWKISIHEKNRFSFFDPNGLFVICKYCVESVHTFYSSLHSIVQFQVLPQLNMRMETIYSRKNNFSFLILMDCLLFVNIVRGPATASTKMQEEST